MKVVFKKLRWKNFLSTGEMFTEIQLDRTSTTMLTGKMGAGKCLKMSTPINIEIEDEEIRQAYLKFIEERHFDNTKKY